MTVCDSVKIPLPIGKYVTSLIDGVTYCRKNGSFLKHLRISGYDYQSYYDTFYGPIAHCAHCSNIATFHAPTMQYKSVCGRVECRNEQIRISKQLRTPDQWSDQLVSFRNTMSNKSIDEIESIKDKRKQTTRDRVGVEFVKQLQISPNSLQLLNDRDYMLQQHIGLKKTAVKISEDLDVGITTATNYLHKHDIDIQSYRSSQVERDILLFLTELIPNIIIKNNDRSIIHPLELDIYLPEFSLAIEVNGIYWHGESKGKNRSYHLNKSMLCKEKGIRLIHLTDGEWYSKQDCVKSRLRSMLGKSETIYARKCSVKLLTSNESKAFFDANHIQTSVGSKVCLGLIHNDVIVAAMSFGNARYTKQAQWELLRYANVLDTSVVGGASKLFKRFVAQYHPESITTYSDIRWNSGALYSILGFTYSHDSTPNYWYFDTNKPYTLHSRQRFQKHTLKNQLDSFDETLTEWQNMCNNGYDRIWDCGNMVFFWHRSSLL